VKCIRCGTENKDNTPVCTQCSSKLPCNPATKAPEIKELQLLKDAISELRLEQTRLQAVAAKMNGIITTVSQELSVYEKVRSAPVESSSIIKKRPLVIPVEKATDRPMPVFEPTKDPDLHKPVYHNTTPEIGTSAISDAVIQVPAKPVCKTPVTKKKKRHTEENFVNVVISRIGVFFVTVAFLVLYSSFYLAVDNQLFRISTLIALGLFGIFLGRLADKKNSPVLADAMISVGLALELIAVVVATDSLAPWRVQLGVLLVPILMSLYVWVLCLAFYLLRRYTRFSTYVLSIVSISTVTIWFVWVFAADGMPYLSYTFAYMSLLYNILVVSKFSKIKDKGLCTFMVPSLIYALLPQLSRLEQFDVITLVLNLVGLSLLLYQGYLLAQKDNNSMGKLAIFGFIWIGFSFLIFDVLVVNVLMSWNFIGYPFGLTVFFYTALQIALWLTGLSIIAKKKLSITNLYQGAGILKIFAYALVALATITLINVFNLYEVDAGAGYLILATLYSILLLSTAKGVSQLFIRPSVYGIAIITILSPFIAVGGTYWALLALGVAILMIAVTVVLYVPEFGDVRTFVLGQSDETIYKTQIINGFYNMLIISSVLFVILTEVVALKSNSLSLILVGLVFLLMSHAYKLYVGKKECIGVSGERVKTALWTVVTGLNYLLYGASTMFLLSDVGNSALVYTTFFIYLTVTTLSEFHLFFKRFDQKSWTLDRQSLFALVRALVSILLILVSEDVATVWLDVALGLSLVIALFAGFKFNLKELRLCGLALVFVLAAKLLLLDSWNLTTLLKVASYGMFGVTLIAIAYVYNKYFLKIQN